MQTLFFLFKFVTSETKESFVTRTNASIVGGLISIGDVSVSIAIHVVPYFKTVNWILAAGRVRERYIRKGNKKQNKSNGELDLYLPNISVCNFATQTFNGN